jgi:serine/threonine protein phosphatase PrpC
LFSYSTNANGHSSHHLAGTLFSMNCSDVAGGVSTIGSSGIVAYFRGQHLFVVNVGNMLAVMSRHGHAHVVSVKHEPFDRNDHVMNSGMV